MMNLRSTGGKIVQPYTDDEFNLFRAASSGNISIVERLLEMGVSSSVLINGFSAVHISIKKNNLEVVKRLMDHDSSLALSTTADGRTCSMLASFEGHLDILKFLCNQINNDIEKLDREGNDALHYSCWGGHIECAKYLIEEKGFLVTRENREGMVPMQYACAGNHSNLVKYLSDIADSEQNRSSHQRSVTGMSSIHRAAMHGAIDTIRILLNADASLKNTRNSNNSTPLHLAVQHNYFDIVRLLVEHFDADVQASNDYGLTPLHLACIG